MKKLKRFWLNIPRKCRVFINLSATLLLVFAFYILAGSPAMNPVEHFRRLEKAYLVGPSKILEIVDLPANEYDHMIVADDGDAVILFGYNDVNYRWDWNTFVYREKRNGITALPIPAHHYGIEEQVIELPIFLFHNYPNAVRAELEFTLGESLEIPETVMLPDGSVTQRYFEKSYTLESQREIDGYFRFHLHAEIEGKYVGPQDLEVWKATSGEGTALRMFARMAFENGMYLHEYVPMTVRLYDRNNGLIVEDTFNFRSTAGERYANDQQIP